ASWPPVTILKPVCGLEKNLRENLRSACAQDYPEYQVVFSVQAPDDPALPLVRELQREFGAQRVSIAVDDRQTAPNGKIKNLLGGFPYARYDIFVISDSDVLLRPDYLKAIVAPLDDSNVGYVCTLYKASRAGTWFEKLELLTINADVMSNIVFAHVSGVSKVCLGGSTALHRSTLKDIGGFEALGDYLVEDYEMGQRILKTGKKNALVFHLVDTIVDLKTVRQWWTHQLYWDQNIRVVEPVAFFGTVVVRAIPFALIFAALRLDAVGLAVLGGAVMIRMATAAGILGWGFKDWEGIKSLALLPIRDAAGLVFWVLAFTKRTVIWRGVEFILHRDGRMVPLP
ncbi:MAG: ceramide glucosyltransferase, partial [Cyanobacteria bacterium 13_1_40CM_2_61_4]